MKSIKPMSRELTPSVREPLMLPLIDSGFECAIGVTGKDDVLLMRGVNILVSDHDLEMDTFSCGTTAGPESGMVIFSSKIIRDFKFSLGKRFLIANFPRDGEGPGDEVILESAVLGVKRKFTLFGVGVGVDGILI